MKEVQEWLVWRLGIYEWAVRKGTCLVTVVVAYAADDVCFAFFELVQLVRRVGGEIYDSVF